MRSKTEMPLLDLNNLSPEEEKTLIALLLENNLRLAPGTGIAGKALPTKLSGYRNDSGEPRIEEEQPTEFAQGRYGKLHRCKTTYHITPEGHFRPHTRKSDSPRLAKRQPNQVTNAAGQVVDQTHIAETEQRNLARVIDPKTGANFYRVKPLIKEANASTIIMRDFKDYKPLREVLNEHDETSLTFDQRLQLCRIILNEFRTMIWGQGLMHRDIQYDNVLVRYKDGKFEVVIVDLAFARCSDTPLPPTDKSGSYVFAAPECFNSEISMSIASDIYSLGRLFMFIWGYTATDWMSTNKDLGYLRHMAANVDQSLLFQSFSQKPACHQELRNLFQWQCSPNMADRPNPAQIDKQLQSLTDLTYAVENTYEDFYEDPYASGGYY